MEGFDERALALLERIAAALEGQAAPKKTTASKPRKAGPLSETGEITRFQGPGKGDWFWITINGKRFDTKSTSYADIAATAEENGFPAVITYTEKPSTDGRYLNRYIDTIEIAHGVKPEKASGDNPLDDDDGPPF